MKNKIAKLIDYLHYEWTGKYIADRILALKVKGWETPVDVTRALARPEEVTRPATLEEVIEGKARRT